MSTQVWQRAFDFAGEEQELRRVGGEIAPLVLEFARKYEGIEFHARELWEYVSWSKQVAPDSPNRILRLLARHGFLTYVVIDRTRSLYRVTEVRR
jgi:hypothetical protein